MKALFTQFIRFGLVGVSNTVISYVVYEICIHLGLHYLLAGTLGFLISVVNSFYWNNRYVFRKAEGEERSLWKAFVKTFLSYAGTGLVLSNLLLIVWVDGFHLSEDIAPLINLVITVPLNFVLNKLWAFKEKKHDSSQ